MCSRIRPGVLVDLAGDEERAHQEGDDEPAAQALDVTTLGGEDTHLAGHRRQHQDRRVDRREGTVEVAGDLGPDLGALDGADGEVHREQRREEHQLGREPDDGPDADDARPVRRSSVRSREGCGCGCGRHGCILPVPARASDPDPPVRLQISCGLLTARSPRQAHQHLDSCGRPIEFRDSCGIVRCQCFDTVFGTA